MGSALLSRLPPHSESCNPTVAHPAIPVMNELQAGAPLHDFLVHEGPAAMNDKPRLSHRPKEYRQRHHSSMPSSPYHSRDLPCPVRA